jgi:asparagine synthase (glutamine-hydrolysing)
MCGIAGILNLVPQPPPSREELRTMVESLRHRGPDESGFYASAEVGLGHARLSIIDLAGGSQPIPNEDRTVWVIFNGEIFNYLELRRDLLAQGHVFSSHSDTEVIVHLYEQHGDDFVRRLNGQFAIALWDCRRKRLVLARDRVGIRPLFYTTAGHRFLFASEVKSLFTVAGVPRRVNPRALAEVFTFWSPLPPGTLFEGIRSLPPGHLMVVRPETGEETITRYWDWAFPDEPIEADRPTEAYLEELRALLVDAVRLQLRSDVPVGAYLSGGLDSSIITALIKHYTDAPLRTFSITFQDAEFDESPFQRRLVAHLGTDHTATHCTAARIGEAFPRTIWHAESTILRTAPTPLLLLSSAVRDAGYKVVLTGEGADEVFGGYDLFKEAKVRRFWARRPASTVRPLLLDRLYPYLSNSPTAARSYAQHFFRQGLDLADRPYFGHIPRWLTTRRAWRLFSRDLADSLRGWDPYEAIEARLPAAIRRWPPLCRDQYLEAHTLMSGYLLSSQGDRVAMANSIEGRFPYLDHRVIEFACRLPPLLKVMGLQEKYLLKRVVEDLLPSAIRARPKQPYRAPDSASFFRDGRPVEYVEALLRPERIRSAGFFDPGGVGKLVEKCRSGKAIGFADNMAFVGILSTMLLDEMFVRGSRISPHPGTQGESRHAAP